jgi:short-subunit dehydrogenase
MEFKGKIALVTGASRGIGYAIAERLSKDGANLVLTATSNKIEEVAKQLSKKYNIQAIGVAGDISKEVMLKLFLK